MDTINYKTTSPLSAGMNSHGRQLSDSLMTGGAPVLTVNEAQVSLLEGEVLTLRESLKQQRILNAHILTIREEERTNIAREIQEELGQMLASLKMNVSLIAEEYRDHAHLVARALAMEQLITISIMTVQRVSSQLRPVMLDILGITEALEWQSQEFQKKSGIACRALIHLKEKKVSPNIASAIYRICEEALNKIVRFSGAKTVQVVLMERNGWLTLSVSDDGQGIDHKKKNDGNSLCIKEMRSWVEAIGGKLRISSSPLRGTGLFARIPVGMKGDKRCYL